MTLSVDLFWSFRSPYSYLATPRLVALEAEYDLDIAVRPVRPIALREPDFFEKRGDRWMGYTLTDVVRLAEFLGLPIAMPNPDPVVIDPATRRAAQDQPHLTRLNRLAVEAVAHGSGLAFLDQVSRLVWSGEPWSDGDRLAAAVAESGLDLADLEARVAGDPDARDAVIRENESALETSGHWGVPTLVFEGEPFFGQDRIDLCVWRMKQKGLQAR
ncbi:2-hydroxychromene-2-carboxylate isomerase [Hyphobacterium marinum]|uniref:2-hydroxychromene-2-carboxylate isomerase n=1 Tax=Hyphobacterium marinum TaxID=3116574 RepID=A0ABU7LYD4_9PROT|nr:DsbA family protein [Hyphobacterium sp. Y6023]MEE2566282.1 DsbA family protein [Hyphobacterium sp. Y6023]